MFREEYFTQYKLLRERGSPNLVLTINALVIVRRLLSYWSKETYKGIEHKWYKEVYTYNINLLRGIGKYLV